MSKRVQAKIKSKHPDSFCYTDRSAFTQLQKNTIAHVPYSKDSKKEDDTFNFIAYLPENQLFFLYALKREKHHTSCTTIFKLRKSTLRKYYKDNRFVLIKNDFKIIVEEYIN